LVLSNPWRVSTVVAFLTHPNPFTTIPAPISGGF
jgi:hypothetical protein